MRLWRMITAAYSISLDKRPVLTEMTTSGCIWSLGDLASQRLETINYPSENKGSGLIIDWRRTLHQTVYASILWAPVAHKWYHLLDQFAQALVPSGKPSHVIATKLFLEIVCLHPASLLAYFTAVGSLNGESMSSIKSQLKANFWPTFLLEISLWTPLDVLNFAFVPVRHQLLVVNCGCFVESVGLSFIKNNGIESMLPGCRVSSADEKEKTD